MEKSLNIKDKKVKTKFTETDVIDVIERYLNLESAGSISRDYRCSDDYVISTLRKNNIKIRDKGSVPSSLYDELKIVYESGVSVPKLMEKYGYGRKSITTALSKVGVSLRSYKEAKFFIGDFSLNRSAFTNFNDEPAAYFYGWLLADGCLNDKGRSISIELKSDDEEVLLNLKNYLDSNNKILSCSRKDIRSSKVYHSAKFYFADKDMISRLVGMGFSSRKSLSETCPEILKLNRHFWRGFLEGDDL